MVTLDYVLLVVQEIILTVEFGTLALPFLALFIALWHLYKPYAAPTSRGEYLLMCGLVFTLGLFFNDFVW